MKRHHKVQETYKTIRLLGEGSYGKALLVRSNNENKNYYVMKTISLTNMNEEKKKKKIIKKNKKKKKKKNI